MDWFIDSTGTWCKYVDPDATITDYFEFTTGNDITCARIDILSFTTSVNGDLTIVDSEQIGSVVKIQASGNGDLRIMLTLSNGDVRPAINRYKESNRSLAF